MLAQRMKDIGITSDVLQILGFASVLGSIATWRTATGSGDSAHAERFGIFVGLWAPTFFALAGQLAVVEAQDAKAIDQNS
ncbi:MAG: hypothetical protein ABI720_13515 [Actinomycetes bacterium]